MEQSASCPRASRAAPLILSKTAKAARCWWQLQTPWSCSHQTAPGCEYQKNPRTLGTRQKFGKTQPALRAVLGEGKTLHLLGIKIPPV